MELLQEGSGELLKKVTEMADNINHPLHYKWHPAACECGKSIECIQIVEHMNFNLGCVVKYLWRHNHKGKPLEDLKKAAFYLNREILKHEKI